MFPQESKTDRLIPEMKQWTEVWTGEKKGRNKHSESKDYLQVFHLQGVHIEANDVAWGGEAVAGLYHMTELGLRKELLLC